MPSPRVMNASVSIETGGTSGVNEPPALPQLARLLALREALTDENRSAAAVHRATAPVLSQMLDAYGKDNSAASVIGKTPQKLRDYKAGDRGLSAGELIGICLESGEAWQALRSQIDAYHEARELKPAEAVEILLTVATMNPAVMAQAQQIAATRHGVEPEELLRAIRMLARFGPKRVTRADADADLHDAVNR
jgi:hypothetical protein